MNTACQYVVDNLVYLEAVTGDVLGVLVALRALAEDETKDAQQLRADLRAVLNDFDVGELSGEVPGAIHQSLEGIDEIVVALGRTVPHIAVVDHRPADVVSKLGEGD